MTAILLTQLFQEHSTGLEILLFQNNVDAGSLFLINIQKKKALLKTKVEYGGRAYKTQSICQGQSNYREKTGSRKKVAGTVQ